MDTRTSTTTLFLRVVLFALFSIASFSSYAAEFVAIEPEAVPALSALEQKKEQIRGIFQPALAQDTIYSYVDGDRVTINLSNEIQAIQNLYTGQRFRVQWDLQGYEGQLAQPRFDLALTQVGDRKLTFSLYEIADDTDVLLYTRDLNIFVYSRSIPTISFLPANHRFHTRAHEQGVLLYPLYTGVAKDLEASNASIYETYQQYFQKIRGPRSNFILVLGGRNEGVDTIHAFYKSLMTYPGASNTVVSFVLVTPDSLQKASDIARIFLSGKQQIAELLITTADNTYIPLFAADSVSSLQTLLLDGGYDYIALSPAAQDISWYAFVSRFANSLTNSGMDRQDIYMLLLVPFLLTGVVLFRHLLGFGGIGILLPVFLTYLAFYETWYVVVGLYSSFFFLNVLVSKFFRGYAMLYVPRIAFVLSLNILFFIFAWDVLYTFDNQIFSPDHLMSYILFFFLLERTIGLIWSKDFGEYFPSFLNTILFVAVAYGLGSLEFTQRLILGAPELLLILVPINFFFGRYRGLRLTEYFRFRELLGREFEE